MRREFHPCHRFCVVVPLSDHGPFVNFVHILGFVVAIFAMNYHYQGYHDSAGDYSAAYGYAGVPNVSYQEQGDWQGAYENQGDGDASERKNQVPTHGNPTTMNLDHVLHQNILSSPYFKKLYDLKT